MPICSISCMALPAAAEALRRRRSTRLHHRSSPRPIAATLKPVSRNDCSCCRLSTPLASRTTGRAAPLHAARSMARYCLCPTARITASKPSASGKSRCNGRAVSTAKDEHMLAGEAVGKHLLEQSHGRCRHPVVDSHGGSRQWKLKIRQTEYVLGRFQTEHRILAEAIAADAQARIANILMRRPNPDRLEHLEQIDVDAPGEFLPLIDQRDVHGPISVFQDLGGFHGADAVEPRQRPLSGVDKTRQERLRGVRGLN